MALADLAKEGEGSVVPLATISARQNISLPYLEQLFLKMRRGGIVHSMRGPGGGYALARAAEDIRIIEIMMAVDEPVKMTRCAGDAETGCVGDNRCLTHDLWDALGEQIISFLDGVSLGDVVDNARAKEVAKARTSKSRSAQRSGNDHAGAKR
jgi:Rrf2 family protein